MTANDIMNSAFQKIDVFGKPQRGTHMLRILLADDNQNFLSRMESHLKQYAARKQLNIQIGSYTRDDISSFILQSYDLAFLDIDFGNRRGAGIDLARQIRQKRNETIIIFVTSYVEYAPEGYELRAFRYLLKTDVDTKLELYFSQAVEHFTTKREVVSIQNNGEIINLAVDDILYLESEKHTVHIHMLCGNFDQYSCYSSLQSFEEKLQPLGFLRIQKSYLVNMRHIKKLQCNEVVIENGLKLPVSEKNYKEIKRAYLLWKGAQTWNT